MSKKNVHAKIRHALCLLLTAVFVLGTTAIRTQAARPVWTADIENCVVNEDGRGCEEKMVLTVPVSYGLDACLELFDACDTTGLEHGVKVEISKDPPTLYYPLTYFHTVSYFPHEEVIKVRGIGECIDCNSASHPTCGWIYQGGHKIRDSQAFCAGKTFEQLQEAAESCSAWRGEEILGQYATLCNPFSTAHCLRMGHLFFHGYEVGQPIRFYEVYTEFTVGGLGGDDHNFPLTPAEPVYATGEDADYSGDFQMRGELVGDMEKYKDGPDLSNYILYIPAAPDGHPLVENYHQNMLLVPREEVSKDGGELDKVGVSFYSFRKLMGPGNASVTEAGDGLHNQLFGKHNEDLSALSMNPNAEATYLVHGKRVFKRGMEFAAGMEKVLKYEVPEIQNSLVSLTTNRAGIKVVETESEGIIRYAQILTFTSMSNEGTLEVEIENIGDLKTGYIVTVTDMAGNNIIHAVPAQARTLGIEETAILYFDIFTQFNVDASHLLSVHLKSPTGKLYDFVDVMFDTKKHHSKYSWELQQQNEGSQTDDDDANLPPDEMPPVITLNSPDDTVVLAVGDDYNEPNAVATDNCDGNDVPVVVGGDVVDTTVAGIYVVTYDANDIAGNYAKQLTRTVIVRDLGAIDTVGPEIILLGPAVVNLEVGETYEEAGAIAIDDVDGFVDVTIDSSAVNTSVVGTYPVTYDANDYSDNAATQVQRTVIIQDTTLEDTTPPEIMLIGPNVVNLDIGETYDEFWAIAFDDVDGLVDVEIGGDVVDTSVAGVYTVTYDANDSSGNQADQVTRTVAVGVSQDTTPPQLLLSATPTTLWPANHKMVKITVTMIATDETDPSPVVSLVDVTLSEGSKADDVEIHNEGLIYLRAETIAPETSRVYTIIYRAVDASGNPTEESVTITVPHDQSNL